MRTRSFRLLAALGLLLCVAGAWAQSTAAPTAQSVDTLKKLAASGDSNAQYKLAGHYLAGAGVQQSTAEALVWFRKAAERGDAKSQYELGQLYEDGGPMTVVKRPDGLFEGTPATGNAAIPKDIALAAIWFRKAAERGYSLAQNHLGMLYENGEGIPQDYREAYFWLSLGEANGSTSTTNDVDERDRVASHLTKAVLLQTQERARKWVVDHPAKTPLQ